MIQPPISIMKSLWTRGEDRVWKIHDLKSLALRPKKGCEDDYFMIDSDIELMTQSPSGMDIQQVLSSFGPIEFLMRQSIVPVVAWVTGENYIRVIGTASIISCSGYVLTAAHVLLDPYEVGYGAKRQGKVVKYFDNLNFGVFIERNPATGISGFTFCPFERFWLWGDWEESPLIHEPPRYNPKTDVAICKIPELPLGRVHQPLNISLHPFVQSEAAYSIGYAEMAPISVEYKNGEEIFKRFSADLYVSTGQVSEVYPQNHIQMNIPTPGPAFEFRAKIPGKMSGAPIFGANGAIIRGVVSRSFEDDRHASGAMLGPAMDLPLDEPGVKGRTLRTLMQGGNEGITKVRGIGL